MPASNGIPDPLDFRVVEAYWVGNSLLDSVGITNIGNSMEDRFRARTGRQFPHLAEGVLAGGVPHHSFHVFEIYPWLGLLLDDRRHATALNVLDRCRIRWGEVLAITGDDAVVRSRPLVWDGAALAVGEPVVESAKHAVNGTGFVAGLAAGDVVSLHWDWVCDRLSPRQLQRLQHFTARHLRIANDGVEHRGAAIALERYGWTPGADPGTSGASRRRRRSPWAGPSAPGRPWPVPRRRNRPAPGRIPYG